MSSHDADPAGCTSAGDRQTDTQTQDLISGEKCLNNESPGARPKSKSGGSKKKTPSKHSTEAGVQRSYDKSDDQKAGKDTPERPNSGRTRSGKKDRIKRTASDDHSSQAARSQGHHSGHRGHQIPHDSNIQGHPERSGSNNDNMRNQQSRRQGHQQNRGQNTGHNQQRYQKSRQSNKQAFERHLDGEQLSKGLKSGLLIQGPIRINPKKFDEAYVPHPDGVSDICINCFKDRNRALNGDVVAVQLFDSGQWQVNNDQLQDLVDSLEGGEDCCKDETTSVIPKGDGAFERILLEHEGNSDCIDSDPDVIIESEEVLETDGCVQRPDMVDEKSSEGVTSDVNTSEISEKILALKITKEESRQKGQSSETLSKPSNEQVASPAQVSSQKKFTRLQDLQKEGSPAMKSLFSPSGDQASNVGKNKIAPSTLIQRTGKVVAILEPKHSRACTGHIILMTDKYPNHALFSPIDSRVPRIMVPMAECPKDFHERPNDHANTLFIARIREWRENSSFAHGNLMRSLGEKGQIEPETEGILIENDVDYSEFSEQALDSLPIKSLPWRIPPSELESRRDFRDQCVFTIDPATARDLDDALSCEECEDGTYNVGVHIADVSYFLKEDTVLDKVAAKRATSVYLVQKVIPMLPRILCEELCSLNPDEDRLTFSVVWNLSVDGEVYSEWFGRSVIRSCVKLSYDHAQGFIEEPSRVWTKEELPPISPKFTVQQIKERVLNLNKIAVKLRKLRFDNGALRLDQVKLSFTLDSETGMPNGYRIYQQRDSNKLVEEFMLLANMAVAHKINSVYPKTALLRRHPKPQTKMIEELAKLCDSLGVPIDVTSAGTLQTSIWRYCGNDEYSTARMQVLTALCSKPMQMAKYFSNGCIDDEDEYRHYALNVPLYTHFTSPIRRFADVLVHRALAGALGYTEYTRSLLSVQRQSENCNDKKTASKRVQELSSELFFAVFVKEAGPFEELGMVMAVLDKAFDVYILKLGVTKRVYCDKLPLKNKTFVREQKQPVLTLTWEPTDTSNNKEVVQRIAIFSLVKCVLQAGDLPLMWMATIKAPTQ